MASRATGPMKAGSEERQRGQFTTLMVSLRPAQAEAVRRLAEKEDLPLSSTLRRMIGRVLKEEGLL